MIKQTMAALLLTTGIASATSYSDQDVNVFLSSGAGPLIVGAVEAQSDNSCTITWRNHWASTPLNFPVSCDTTWVDFENRDDIRDVRGAAEGATLANPVNGNTNGNHEDVRSRTTPEPARGPVAFTPEELQDVIRTLVDDEDSLEILTGEEIHMRLLSGSYATTAQLSDFTFSDIEANYQRTVGYSLAYAHTVRNNIDAINDETFMLAADLEAGDVGAISERILNGSVANACYLRDQIAGRTGLNFQGYSLDIQYDPRAGTASAVAGEPGSYNGGTGFPGFHQLIADKIAGESCPQ